MIRLPLQFGDFTAEETAGYNKIPPVYEGTSQQTVVQQPRPSGRPSSVESTILFTSPSQVSVPQSQTKPPISVWGTQQNVLTGPSLSPTTPQPTSTLNPSATVESPTAEVLQFASYNSNGSISIGLVPAQNGAEACFSVSASSAAVSSAQAPAVVTAAPTDHGRPVETTPYNAVGLPSFADLVSKGAVSQATTFQPSSVGARASNGPPQSTTAAAIRTSDTAAATATALPKPAWSNVTSPVQSAATTASKSAVVTSTVVTSTVVSSTNSAPTLTPAAEPPVTPSDSLSAGELQAKRSSKNSPNALAAVTSPVVAESLSITETGSDVHTVSGEDVPVEGVSSTLVTEPSTQAATGTSASEVPKPAWGAGAPISWADRFKRTLKTEEVAQATSSTPGTPAVGGQSESSSGTSAVTDSTKTSDTKTSSLDPTVEHQNQQDKDNLLDESPTSTIVEREKNWLQWLLCVDEDAEDWDDCLDSFEPSIPSAGAEGSGRIPRSAQPSSNGTSRQGSGEALVGRTKDILASARAGPSPRGLLNTGNSCFLNSTVQALLACPSFYYLLRHLQQASEAACLPSSCPTLAAVAAFAAEFSPETGEGPATGHSGKVPQPSPLQKPFAPDMFEGVLRRFSPIGRESPQKSTSANTSMPGSTNQKKTAAVSKRAPATRQEDAQEFLSHLIDSMHQELVAWSQTQGATDDLGEDKEEGRDEWEEVGRRNKTAITRTHDTTTSRMMQIFGGHLRSVVKTAGAKPSATVQPFTLMPLNISPESVHSVEDALMLMTAAESIQGYRSEKGQVEVAASKSVCIQKAPRVLVLHLVRFTYGATGMGKLLKGVHFPMELTLRKELMAGGAQGCVYELLATVSHHGRSPGGGHYTGDSRRANGQWLRFDDGVVTPITQQQVLHDQAYLLFYQQKPASKVAPAQVSRQGRKV